MVSDLQHILPPDPSLDHGPSIGHQISTEEVPSVWVQLYLGRHHVGEVNEFFLYNNDNISALKKDIKSEYVELRDISPASLEAWYGHIKLAPNSKVPIVTSPTNPLRVLAHNSPTYRKLSQRPTTPEIKQICSKPVDKNQIFSVPPERDKLTVNKSVVGLRAPSPIYIDLCLSPGGETTATKDQTDSVSLAIKELLKPYLKKVQQAGLLCGFTPGNITPSQVKDSFMRAYDVDKELACYYSVVQVMAKWLRAYQEYGIGALRLKLISFQNQNDRMEVKMLKGDPKFHALRYVVLGPATSTKPTRDTPKTNPISPVIRYNPSVEQPQSQSATQVNYYNQIPPPNETRDKPPKINPKTKQRAQANRNAQLRKQQQLQAQSSATPTASKTEQQNYQQKGNAPSFDFSPLPALPRRLQLQSPIQSPEIAKALQKKKKKNKNRSSYEDSRLPPVLQYQSKSTTTTTNVKSDRKNSDHRKHSAGTKQPPVMPATSADTSAGAEPVLVRSQSFFLSQSANSTSTGSITSSSSMQETDEDIHICTPPLPKSHQSAGGTNATIASIRKNYDNHTRASTIGAEPPGTTTGRCHGTMPLRTGDWQWRRCIICEKDTLYECTHEACQQRRRYTASGKTLFGIPVCPPTRGKTNCIDLHQEQELYPDMTETSDS